jgi:hypothetical protein
VRTVQDPDGGRAVRVEAFKVRATMGTAIGGYGSARDNQTIVTASLNEIADAARTSGAATSTAPPS